MKSLLVNIAILSFLALGLFLLTQNAEVIRGLAQTPRQLIAGATTVDIPNEKETLPEELVKDAEKKIDTVKKNALNVTVEEIISFFNKSGKIADDFKDLQKSASEFISQ